MKWEYKVLIMSMPSNFQEETDSAWSKLKSEHETGLNLLGSEGWEWFQTIGALWYFKRPTGQDTGLLIVNNTGGMDQEQLAQAIKHELSKEFQHLDGG